MAVRPRFRILPAGEQAVLIEFGLDAPHAACTGPVLGFLAAAASAADRPDGVGEPVPAARTVLVPFAPPAAAPRVRDWCAGLARGLDADGPPARPCAAPVRIAVTYDGPDLDEVADRTGLGRDGVIAAHTGTDWTVAFSGFAPGFAYLTDGDPRLEVARRTSPRTRVPAGSVGLAGLFSGVYPRASPGGWQLIGTTGAPLWRADADPPALLRPGMTVRFVDAAREAR